MGVFEPGAPFCNNGGDDTCGPSNFVEVEPGKFNAPNISDLQQFVKLWDNDTHMFSREDVEASHDLVLSYISGNFSVGVVQTGKQSAGFKDGTRGSFNRSAEPSRRDSGRPVT